MDITWEHTVGQEEAVSANVLDAGRAYPTQEHDLGPEHDECDPATCPDNPENFG